MKKNVFLCGALIFLTSLSSCDTIGRATTSAPILGDIVGGKNSDFTGDYSISIEKLSIPQAKEKLKKYLLSKGWNKSSESDNEIEFKYTDSYAERTISMDKFAILRAEFNNGNILINIYKSGNYGYGTEKSTNETFEKIKNELLN